MTYDQIEQAIAITRDAGSSRVHLPLTVVKALLAKAKERDAIPAIVLDAAKRMKK